jgi:hypothetical protein
MKEILYALDTLALALTDTGHTWTNEERQNYESAVHFLKDGEG